MQRVDSLEKTDSGRDWGQEEKGKTEKKQRDIEKKNFPFFIFLTRILEHLV